MASRVKAFLEKYGISVLHGSDANGNDDVIDLSHDMVRMLVFNYNAGLYDARLEAYGISK